MVIAVVRPWETGLHTAHLTQLLNWRLTSVYGVTGRAVEGLQLVGWRLCCHQPKGMHRVKGGAHFVVHWKQRHCLRHEPY